MQLSVIRMINKRERPVNWVRVRIWISSEKLILKQLVQTVISSFITHAENTSELLDTLGCSILSRGEDITRKLRDECVMTPLATALLGTWGWPPPVFHLNTSAKQQLPNVANLADNQRDTLKTVVKEACAHWENMRRRMQRRQRVTPWWWFVFLFVSYSFY